MFFTVFMPLGEAWQGCKPGQRKAGAQLPEPPSMTIGRGSRRAAIELSVRWTYRPPEDAACMRAPGRRRIAPPGRSTVRNDPGCRLRAVGVAILRVLGVTIEVHPAEHRVVQTADLVLDH